MLRTRENNILAISLNEDKSFVEEERIASLDKEEGQFPKQEKI